MKITRRVEVEPNDSWQDIRDGGLEGFERVGEFQLGAWGHVNEERPWAYVTKVKAYVSNLSLRVQPQDYTTDRASREAIVTANFTAVIPEGLTFTWQTALYGSFNEYVWPTTVDKTGIHEDSIRALLENVNSSHREELCRVIMAATQPLKDEIEEALTVREQLAALCEALIGSANALTVPKNETR